MRSSRTLPFGAAAFLITLLDVTAGTAIAQPPKICLPAAVGVPGNPGPPDWLTPNQTDARAYLPDDPRWRGAMSIDHGSGSVSQVDFRALHQISGGTRFFFSWRIKVAPDGVDLDDTSLFVGIAPKSENDASDKSKAQIYRFTLRQNSTVEMNTMKPKSMLDVVPAASTAYYDVTQFTWNGTAWISTTVTPANPPAHWVEKSARVWMRNVSDTVTTPGTIVAQDNEWTVQLVIPVAPALVDGVDVSPTSFRMWHYVQMGTTWNTSTPTDIIYTWPRTTTAAPSAFVYTRPSFVHTFPEPTAWGEFSTSGGCAGLTLTTADIGTVSSTGINQSRISLTNPNTFRAEPTHKNPTSVLSPAINAGVLMATFRIANWGSQVGDETASSWVAPTPLTNVPDTVGVAQHPGPPNPDPKGNITASWTLDTAWKCRFTGKNGVVGSGGVIIVPGDPSCPNADPELLLHQCILVDLTGPGVNFLNNSAFRNMDFVQASTFEREAEISVVGLSNLAGGRREVYLYVSTINMPGFTNQSTSDPRRRAGPITLAAVAQPTPSTGAIPMMVVHAYHDSGVEIETDRGTRRLLIPQTSFGYVVEHEGELEGWVTRTVGAERIPGSNKKFKVAVPNNGGVRIQNVIEAVEPKQFGVGVHLGPAIPHNEFDDTHDVGFSAGVDFEYRFAPRYAAVGSFIWTRFGDTGASSETKVRRLSANVRAYFADLRFRPFATAGVGAYMFDPGQSRAGMNVGGGIQVLITHTLAVEGTYLFHAVSNNTPATSYSELLIGARVRF